MNRVVLFERDGYRSFSGEELSYKKALLIIFILGLGIAFVILYGRRELKITAPFLDAPRRESDTQVGCLLVAKVRNRDLRMAFSMVAEDRDQREDLLNKLPVIRHDLLMSANRPEFRSALELRNFDFIREHLLMTINRYAKDPVDDLFFDSYYLD